MWSIVAHLFGFRLKQVILFWKRFILFFQYKCDIMGEQERESIIRLRVG